MQSGECFSRYKIIEPIGAGGMGEVFLAEDVELERLVAIKILPVEFAADSERVRRFIQEAKSISALNHPNILTIYEIGEHCGARFMASEFVKGETLRRFMRRKKMPLAEIFDIGRQITAALQAAHQAGIIHRDIKPENIMLREDNLVKVLDFGLAKLTEQKKKNFDLEAETIAQEFNTHIGMILGTATYMSPEQARGKPVDQRTDLWSVGVVLYEMLAGKLPFTGETINDIIASILTKEPELFDETETYVPAKLKETVAKLLRKERDDRYQTAQALQIDLQSLQKISESNPAAEIIPANADFEKETIIIQPQNTNPMELTASVSALNQTPNHRNLLYAGLTGGVLAVLAVFGWFNLPKAQPDAVPADISAKVEPAAVKVYWTMFDSERTDFTRKRARHIQTLIGDEMTELDDEAVQAIKTKIDRYVERRNNMSQKPFEEGLRVIYGRASQYSPVIIRAYEARQVPAALGLYQAMIESEFHDCLVSPVGSVGLFQFMKETAATYDLAPKDYCNVEKQSDAAARYMSNLVSDAGGNPTLALFAFNIGEGNLLSFLRQLRMRGISERTFWAIRRNRQNFEPPLPDDHTAVHYVPKFFAAAIIGETPEAFELSTTPLTTLREKGKP